MSSICTKGSSLSRKIDEENQRGSGGAATEQLCTEYGSQGCYVKRSEAFSELPKQTMGATNAKVNLRKRTDQPAGKTTPVNYELIEQVSRKALAIIADETLEKEQLEARPKCAAAVDSSKVVTVLGSSRMASNQLRKRLGEGLGQEQVS